MDGGKADVVAKVAAVTMFRTYNDVKLLQKWELEAKGAAPTQKSL